MVRSKGSQASKLDSRGLAKAAYPSTSGKDSKIIYNSPNISGLTVGVSFADGGATSKADSTSWRVNYSTDIMDGSGLTLGYGAEAQKAVDGKPDTADQTLTEMGVEFTSGDFLVSAVQVKDKAEKNSGTDKTTKDQTYNEVELAYNATDVLTLNFIMSNSKEDAKGADTKGDKYSANAFGLKYEIAPGLLANVIYTKADYKPGKGSKDSDGDANTKDSGTTTYFQLRMTF